MLSHPLLSSRRPPSASAGSVALSHPLFFVCGERCSSTRCACAYNIEVRSRKVPEQSGEPPAQPSSTRADEGGQPTAPQTQTPKATRTTGRGQPGGRRGRRPEPDSGQGRKEGTNESGEPPAQPSSTRADEGGQPTATQTQTPRATRTTGRGQPGGRTGPETGPQTPKTRRPEPSPSDAVSDTGRNPAKPPSRNPSAGTQRARRGESLALGVPTASFNAQLGQGVVGDCIGHHTLLHH